jgi:hypothetical protein
MLTSYLAETNHTAAFDYADRESALVWKLFNAV